MEPAYISIGINLAVVIGGVLVTYGKLSAKMATKDDLTAQEGQLRKEITSRLYKEDGTTVYMTRQDCRERRVECGDRVCGRIDELAGEAKASREEQKKYWDEHLRLHKELTEFVGGVKEFMRRQRRESHAPPEN